MAPRFDDIKFNLMRAIELFTDMNHEDMNVYAPYSEDCVKERQVAEKLDNCLSQMIEDGFFDDCDYRAPSSESDGQSYASSMSGHESHEHHHHGSGSDGGHSRESFTGRFKRYIRRMMPGNRNTADTDGSEGSDISSEGFDYGEGSESPRSNSASLSCSFRNGSRNSSASRRSRSQSRSSNRVSSGGRSQSSSGRGSRSERVSQSGQRSGRSSSRSSRR